MLQSHSSSLWFLPLSQRHAALGRPLTSPVTNGHFLPRDKKRPSPPSSSPGIACPRSGSDSSCPLLLLKTHFQTLSFSSALFNFRNSPMRRPPLPKESSLLTDSSRTSASSHPAGALAPPHPPPPPEESCSTKPFPVPLSSGKRPGKLSGKHGPGSLLSMLSASGAGANGAGPIAPPALTPGRAWSTSPPFVFLQMRLSSRSQLRDCSNNT